MPYVENQKAILKKQDAKIIIAEYDKYLNYCLAFGRYSSKPVYNCINLINLQNWKEAIKCFELTYSQTEICEKLFNKLFFTDNETPKLPLAKYLWYKNFKLESNDLVKTELVFSNCTLEHIIPQNPKKDSNWEKYFSTDFIETYRYTLGNMTLLTQKINSAAKNYDFEAKKEVYKKINLAMTLELANFNVPISEEYIKNRYQEIVATLVDEITTIFY